MRVAAIDIGTNSILLLVVERRPDGRLSVVEDRCRVEGLGRFVDRTGVLDEAAIARGLEAIAEYSAVIARVRPDRVAAVGTQAFREAKNGECFLAPATKALGAHIEVVAGLREAKLAFAAVMRSFPDLHQRGLVVCDLGGGSTELIVSGPSQIESIVSLPIGAVRMTERHLGSDPPAPSEISALVVAIDAALAAQALPTDRPLVGVAGTVTTLAAVAQRLDPYDAARVHGFRLLRAEVERQLVRYLELPLAKRRKIRGLDPRRATTIIAGAAILDRVMAKMSASEVIVSDRGIRWGLAYELLES